MVPNVKPCGHQQGIVPALVAFATEEPDNGVEPKDLHTTFPASNKTKISGADNSAGTETNVPARMK